MVRPQPRSTDFWGGLFWIALGSLIIVEAVGMPIPTHLGATVLTGPGLLPGVLGGALIVLGAVLSIRSLAGKVIVGGEGAVDPASVSMPRALGAMVLMIAYGACLGTRQPFIPATIVFITLFIVAFNWQGRSRLGIAKVVAGALAVGVATAFIVEFVFEVVFLVRLP